jgi:hypothetical protein
LHTTARDEALVLGLGTGVSAITVHGAGFRHLDVVEPSDARVRLASVHFEEARKAVFESPGIDLHPVDPRSFLRQTNARYDLISTGPVRIWVAGSTALYSREFYQLAQARLAREGVFEQTLPLDRVGIDDILSAMGTMRAEFSHVWFYASGSRAALVACNHDCAPTPDTLATAGGARRLLRDRLLSPEAVDKFLASTGTRGGGIESLLATDDNLFLELDTPRRNVVDHESSLKSNMALLRSFASPSLLEGTRPPEQDTPGVPSGAESTPIERPGLTRDARHGKTQP